MRSAGVVALSLVLATGLSCRNSAGVEGANGSSTRAESYFGEAGGYRDERIRLDRILRAIYAAELEAMGETPLRVPRAGVRAAVRVLTGEQEGVRLRAAHLVVGNEGCTLTRSDLERFRWRQIDPDPEEVLKYEADGLRVWIAPCGSEASERILSYVDAVRDLGRHSSDDADGIGDGHLVVVEWWTSEDGYGFRFTHPSRVPVVDQLVAEMLADEWNPPRARELSDPDFRRLQEQKIREWESTREQVPRAD